MTHPVTIHRYEDGEPLGPRPDEVAIEEPLEIRVEGEPLAIAMRTPGQDGELAAGWLLSEGIVRSADEIAYRASAMLLASLSSPATLAVP